jgi:trehalose-6-phosphatase
VSFDSIEDMTLSMIPGQSEERNNHILTLHYRNKNETESAIVASKHNRVFYFGLFDYDDVKELTELKNWILYEIDTGDCATSPTL